MKITNVPSLGHSVPLSRGTFANLLQNSHTSVELRSKAMLSVMESLHARSEAFLFESEVELVKCTGLGICASTTNVLERQNVERRPKVI
jgi:hypothetical protein